ncbi:ATP-binding protein [Variovorax saccharolyticus]|uniref:ATP-binding protein n=1 Tax=Variovorax saccharolyticus TaxID=3053516 RepID=UPI002576A30D|nr:ATP-binding protein [Variovorax sp. J31P216]MDM0028380.1 ATP-binding protein [Variovorax sp. J31P216]
MGRLFWKFLLAFWAALIVVGLLMALVLLLLRHFNVAPVPPDGRIRAQHMVGTIASLVNRGQTVAAGQLLREWQDAGMTPSVFVVDDDGREVFGRALATPVLREARLQAYESDGLLRRVGPSGSAKFTVLVQPSELRSMLPRGPQTRTASIFYLPILTALIISLVASGLLAWHIAKPIRNLRWALFEVAEGRLATRVHPLMGRRRDEIANLGQDFDRMADRLQMLVATQRRLLHDVSHELRSPLARMQAAIGLSRQRPERVGEMVGRIERECTRLDALVGGLLTLARVESGCVETSRERVDIVELVAGIADDAQFEARSLNRDVRIQSSGSFVADVQAELLYRALENVVRNAVKYTSEASTVEIDVVAGAQRLVITVKDRGPGLPVGDFGAIFEPFRRMDEGNSDGAGLGLAIAKGAVELHGGTITPTLRAGGGLSMQIVVTRSGISGRNSSYRAQRRGSGAVVAS